MAFVLLIGVLAVLWRVMARGELPTRVGRDGYEWPDIADEASKAIEGLQGEVDALKEGLKQTADSTETAIRELARKQDS